MVCFVGKEPQISKSISPRHPDSSRRECELPWKPLWVWQAEAFKVPSLECSFLSDREILTFRECLICFRIACVSLSLKRLALIEVTLVRNHSTSDCWHMVFKCTHIKNKKQPPPRTNRFFHTRHMFDIHTNITFFLLILHASKAILALPPFNLAVVPFIWYPCEEGQSHGMGMCKGHLKCQLELVREY